MKKCKRQKQKKRMRTKHSVNITFTTKTYLFDPNKQDCQGGSNKAEIYAAYKDFKYRDTVGKKFLQVEKKQGKGLISFLANLHWKELTCSQGNSPRNKPKDDGKERQYWILKGTEWRMALGLAPKDQRES